MGPAWIGIDTMPKKKQKQKQMMMKKKKKQWLTITTAQGVCIGRVCLCVCVSWVSFIWIRARKMLADLTNVALIKFID